ncbi:MAG: hypothetical protein G01um101425_448 [Candidatus Peregrinibacteria bacterium Gr01-1014_25]|nr:MAG: hypothetical protein G01um101425_448 [Candidatus Peregrinibacteria bacterium Gr01-1014_25]
MPAGWAIMRGMRYRLLDIAVCLGLVAFIVHIAWFAVGDSDFWWHVKAGEVMWHARDLIRIDPFAWTRTGLPYVATHEWLAQMLFWATYTLGGPSGIVLLRITVSLGIAALLLGIDSRRLWPNALLVAGAFVVMRQGLIERPQLFSNLLFAAVLAIVLRILHRSGGDRTRLFWLLLGLQVLWVNLHGGAAILTPLLLGCVLVQDGVDAWRGTRPWRDMKTTGLWCGALALALLLSPNHVHTLTYVYALLTDRTAEFIQEWSPHPWPQYLSQLGPLWIIALAALVATHERVIALAAMLLGIGLLSRMGARHEALLLITAVGCTFAALRHAPHWHRALGWLRARPLYSWGITAAVAAAIVVINAPYRAFLLRENLAGMHAFARPQTAVDVIEAENITGRIFNTYNVGGYLLLRDHPVFVDGRNVDYGEPFLKRTLEARYDAEAFRSLEREYGFTVLLLELTDAMVKEGEFAFLERMPDWRMVFVDDWAAVYVKQKPEHAKVITERGFAVLTPRLLHGFAAIEELPSAQLPALEAELRRAADADPRGIGALLTLGRLLRGMGRLAETHGALEEAMKRAPYRYEAYALAASVAALEENWQRSADLYEKTLALTRYLPVSPPARQLAIVFERAGRYRLAEKYRKMAQDTGM